MVVSEGREPQFALASVEVERRPAHAPAFAAVVRLCGEHDLATSAGVREALAPIRGSLLVDLSDCAFLDSSVLTVFVLDARERAHDGQRTELLVPAANMTVRRTLQVSGLTEMLTVHGSSSSARVSSASSSE
jgi:anti-anti-sigma factor